MGREDDLNRLHDALDNHRKVNVVGMFGLGKTELALQYARAHAADYPGGVAWFGAANFGADLSRWVQAELYPEQDLRHLELEQQVTKAWKAWRDFCGLRPALVIVDDVTDYRQQVAPYLPANEELAAPFRFVFTSRSPVANIESFRLPQLTPAAARQLLERLAGPARIEADVAAAAAICQRLGYLPLALTLVGSWLNVDPDRTVADLQKALDEKGLDAPALERDPDDVLTAERNIKAAFAISWEHLQRRSPDGAQLARVLTLFAPVDLPWDLIEAAVATYDQEYVATNRATLVAQSEPRGWQKLWQEFWGWLRQLFRRAPTPTRPASAPVYPVNDPLEARGYLLRLSLLESVRSDAADEPRGSAYRLHPLLRELFAEQWDGFDRERWELAWALGIAAKAVQVPQTVDVETARQFEDLKAQLPLAETILTQAQKDTVATLPADSERYKTAARKVKTANFRLSQRVMLAERFERAEKIYAEAQVTAATGNQVVASRKFGEAITTYQQLVEDARATFPTNSLQLAEYLHRSALAFQQLGRYEDGIAPLQEAVRITESRHKALLLAKYGHRLAVLFRFTAQYDDAELLFKRVLTIRQTYLTVEHLDYANSLNSLSVVYARQGRHEEEEELLTRSLQIREQQLGAKHPDVATSLSNLAMLYRTQGRYGEAEPLFQRSLSIHEQQLGGDHPDVRLSLNGLAGLYQDQGRYGEAEPLYLRSLSIREQQLGADHPDVAIGLNNLAGLYQAQGRYDEAEPLYLRAIEIWVKALPAEHPYIAMGQNNFTDMIRAAVAAGQADQLSYHPTTQAILQQLRSE